MMRVIAVIAILLLSAPAHAEQISGAAKAIDSTTIQIGEQRIMLFGIDSVMRKQLCMMDGKPWQCWPAAVKALQGLLDAGPARCDTVGNADVFGRWLARCEVNDQSVNEALVAQGFAVARTSESSEYVAAESSAKQNKLGLWKGQFQPPSAFRRAAGIAVERP
jgi:endonuclease YncB( thermonuclease family)